MRVKHLLAGSFFSISAVLQIPANAFAHEIPSGFTELTQRLSPAVVNISTAQTVEISEDQRAFPEGSPLERFNDFFGGDEENRISRSLGSGFVVDANGYIVTNNHVIEDADTIEAAFPNGDSYQAELIGRDPATDIALLKIDAGKELPFVEFADPDSAQVGEWVIAIGNPLGYNSSVAAGIVSARNRNISMGNYDDFIQTDVAINKGNSGGPLFNLDGQVVGVNTAIASPTGFSVGLSFSIPADLASSVVDQLRKYGETRRGFLGVRVQEVDRNLARAYGLKEPHGALIRSITKDSPAEKAGLKRGDLIIALGDEKLENSSRLARRIAESEIGVPLKVEFMRKQRKKIVNITIERLKEQNHRDNKIKSGESVTVAGNAQGISVEALTGKDRRRYGLDGDTPGVVVTGVDKSSDAHGKLRKGDLILEVAQEAVENPSDFAAKMKTAAEAELPIVLLVSRGGVPYFYSLNPNA